MAVNTSHTLIAFILNVNVNKKDLRVAVLIGIVDLTLLLRAKHVVSICLSTVNKHSYLYQKLAENCCVTL